MNTNLSGTFGQCNYCVRGCTVLCARTPAVQELERRGHGASLVGGYPRVGMGGAQVIQWHREMEVLF